MRGKGAVQVASTREKGKIAREEWPKIVSRYSDGETIASIGRGYGCTAPAIRYIIKRSGMLKREIGAHRSSPTARSTTSTDSTADGAAKPLLSGGLPGVAVLRRMDRSVLDADVRKRVSGDLATFLVALDHVVADGSINNLANLRDATDCLMRSIARTRLEVERLLGSDT